MKKQTLLNWSGGKDAAVALYELQQASSEYTIEKLVTTVSSQYQRVSMHGVRVSLLEAQAKSVGLPLEKIELPEAPSMASYDSLMKEYLEGWKGEGFTHSAFGDIFLEDLKKYREARLSEVGFGGVFPLWGLDTKEQVIRFLTLGFKAVIVCVNEKYLDKTFAGRILDEKCIEEFPLNVDPCGENGEFHTFVYDGPIFKNPISWELGEVVYKVYKHPKKKEDNCFVTGKDEQETVQSFGFWFADILPK